MARADLAVASPTPSPSLFLSNLTILGKMNSIKKLASYPPALFWRFWFRPSWLGYLLTWTVHELQQLWNQVHSRTKKYCHESSHIKVSEIGVYINLFSSRKAFSLFSITHCVSCNTPRWCYWSLIIYLFIYHWGLLLNIEHFRPLRKKQTNKGKQKWQK